MTNIDKIDIASIVTHYENQTVVSGKIPRLKHFLSQLQTVLGKEHEVCNALANSEIFSNLKVLQNFKSQIVINLDSILDKNSTKQKTIDQELEEQLDSMVFASPKASKPIDIGFESMIDEKQQKRRRSKNHMQRKHKRNELNRAKKELLNGLNL